MTLLATGHGQVDNDIEPYAGMILCMRSAKERRRYIATPSLIGRAQSRSG